MVSSSSNSRFADITSVEEFIEGQENNNTKKKTEQNVALLKEFLRLKGESRPVEEIPPQELSSFISEFIITVRKKESKGSMSQLIHANSQVKKAILDDQG